MSCDPSLKSCDWSPRSCDWSPASQSHWSPPGCVSQCTCDLSLALQTKKREGERILGLCPCIVPDPLYPSLVAGVSSERGSCVSVCVRASVYVGVCMCFCVLYVCVMYACVCVMCIERTGLLTHEEPVKVEESSDTVRRKRRRRPHLFNTPCSQIRQHEHSD